MLDFFGYENWSRKLLDITEDMLVDGRVLTPDLGGTASTAQVGDEFLRRLSQP